MGSNLTRQQRRLLEDDSNIRFISVDPSLRNTAIVYGVVTKDLKLIPLTYDIIRTEKTPNKQVRASSDLIERSRDLVKGITSALEFVPKITFAETPSGSKSASGMKSYATSCMIIALMKPDALEVTPIEVKKLTTGDKSASKDKMMKWAENTYPDFPYKRNKDNKLVKSEMEHVCDAIATAHAGLQTSQFKQISKLIFN